MNLIQNVPLRTALLGAGDPSLVFSREFAVRKALNDGIGPALTLTRATDGTYFDSAGILQTAGAGVARFTHNPDTLASQGLLIEEAATNICLQSEDFSTTWTQLGTASVSTDQTTAPDGNTTADELTAGNAVFGGVVARQSIAHAQNQRYTVSVFAKKINHRYLGFRLFDNVGTDAAGNVYTFFDFDTESWTEDDTIPVDTATQKLPNGWYRLTMSGTTPAVLVNNFVDFALAESDGNVNYTPAGTEQVYLWGAQVETTGYASAYIKTTSGSATRNADDVQAASTSFFNPNEGTIFCEYTNTDTTAVSPSRTLWQFSDGSLSDQFWLSRSGPSVTQYGIFNGVFQAEITGAGPVEGVNKSACVYKINDANFYLNGLSVGSDLSVVLPTGINEFVIGQRWNKVSIAGLPIGKIAYYNVRKSNNFLASKTSL